ncbi:hypothetical protein HII31_01727 [Pseudocercospora fuligena]|uniref:Ubiquinol-cytochrome-c reductase cytochrome c1 n=1 Tax=Pseudocercospora fuligena TaxID=685502 RepID=A0A8H6RSR6_9PEZI|nr:hypothetical protein HII31_01727 [Pseudocercospora fuligena]
MIAGHFPAQVTNPICPLFGSMDQGSYRSVGDVACVNLSTHSSSNLSELTVNELSSTMPKNRPDEQRVYMALRHEFLSSPPAAKTSNIVKRLQKCTRTPELTALLQAYSIDSVSNVVKVLLKEGVYSSTLQAKLRFPDLFEVSPAQSAEREASEAEAARNEIQTLNEFLEHDGDDDKEQFGRDGLGVVQVIQPCETMDSVASTSSLWPVYFPLKTQHKLLIEVQRILEEVCFRFASQRLEDVLKTKGWSCPEAVELNVWTGVLRSRQVLFTEAEISSIGKSYIEFLRSITKIRHTAVHRQPISAKLVEQLLQDAEVLTKLLKDEAATGRIAQLRRRTQFVLAEIERNKDSLGAKIVATQKDFANRRAELDRLEKSAVAEMLAEDSEYQKLAGERLEEDIILAGTDHSVPFEEQVETEDADSDSGASGLDDGTSQATLEQSKDMPADHDVELL